MWLPAAAKAGGKKAEKNKFVCYYVQWNCLADNFPGVANIKYTFTTLFCMKKNKDKS